MSQFNAPQMRRKGGELDVYTGLLLVATIVLGVGVAILFMNNTTHSSSPNGSDGGAFKLVD